MRNKEPLTCRLRGDIHCPCQCRVNPSVPPKLKPSNNLRVYLLVPRMFFWTDAERKCPEGWGFIASVRQGVPPSGIEAELDAWADQYPKAWLAVDLRDGAIPPSTVQPLNDVLTGLKRPVIVIVSRSPEHEEWPQWVLPE